MRKKSFHLLHPQTSTLPHLSLGGTATNLPLSVKVMLEHLIFKKIAVITAILTGTTLSIAPLLAATPSSSSPKNLVDEAWQIVNRTYVDPTFNHQDWQAVRREYLSRTYTSKLQAYQAIDSMVAKLDDRYTSFFDPQEYRELNDDIDGEISGIGVKVGSDRQTKALIATSTVDGSPAAKAGILPNDIILKIDGRSTKAMKIEDVGKGIMGAAGTKVKLTVQRGSEVKTFTITRAKINSNPVTYSIRSTATGKIGYIRLPEFTKTAPLQMASAIRSLEQQHVRGYVLDLRDDPGGLVNSSLAIANMWLKQGGIVSLVDRDLAKESFQAAGHPLTDKPLVVLVDRNSASASEILAGALQDDNRATLVGTRTYGKGLVQSVRQLSDGSALKVTVAKYYTPKGRDINHVGIEPDIAADLSDRQLNALIQNHTAGTLVDPQYITAVTNLNQAIQIQASGSPLPTP